MKTLFSSKVTIFFISLSLSLMILLGFSLSSVISIERPIKVIDLTSLTQEEALAWAQENQLKLELVSAFDEDLPIGSILSQTISVGERLYADSSLTITVSSGPDPDKIISLVDFTGKDIGEVQTFIDLNKLTNASIAFEKSTLIQPAFFIKKSVDSSSIKRSDTIVFTISSGDQTELTSVTVPDFSNYTKQQITSWATTSNVKVNFIEAFSSNAPAGSVFEQSLAANSSVYNGSSLTVKISLGAGVVLENLVGKSKSDIDAFITSKGLKAVYTNVYSSTVAKDLASSMSPSATTRVADGSTVNITLSLGKVSVKDFTGKTQKELDAWIADVNKQGANLKSTSSSEYSATVTSGALISQSPSNGEVNPGSSISVKVSKGSGVTVKSFTSRNDTQSGLNVSVVERYSTSASGTVLSQSIAAGTTVDTNSTITLTVSIGTVPVLSKVSRNISELQTWINSVNDKGANLSLSVSDVYNDSQKGIIVTQNPSTGNIAPGSTITATVSKYKSVTLTNLVGSSIPVNIDGITFNTIGSEYSSTVTSGNVIWQSKSAGIYDYGITVDLKTSLGQRVGFLLMDFQDMNSLSNKDLRISQIGSYCLSKELTCNIDTSNVDAAKSGYIISSSPGANSTVYSGDTITIYMYR